MHVLRRRRETGDRLRSVPVVLVVTQLCHPHLSSGVTCVCRLCDLYILMYVRCTINISPIYIIYRSIYNIEKPIGKS